MNDALRDLNKKAPEVRGQEVQQAIDGSAAFVTDAAGYVSIKFQCGPIGEVGVNGTSIENVIELLLVRLRGFQDGGFKCRENALAITHLEEAQNWLERRTRDRVKRGVEGVNRA